MCLHSNHQQHPSVMSQNTLNLNCPVCGFSYAITNITTHIVRRMLELKSPTRCSSLQAGGMHLRSGILNAAALTRHQGIRHCQANVLPLPTPSATQPDPATCCCSASRSTANSDASPLIAQASRDTSWCGMQLHFYRQTTTRSCQKAGRQVQKRQQRTVHPARNLT